jgi:Lon protease-like protein
VNVIPLFPLNIALFPEGPLPLRIFETRYLDMVRSCMRNSSSFGVVLIRAGREVGHAETYDVGTMAKIVDFLCRRTTLSDTQPAAPSRRPESRRDGIAAAG